MAQTQLACGLIKQEFLDTGWQTPLNNGFDALNTRLSETYAGDPNTHVQGHYIGRTVFDTTNKICWVCTFADTAALSKWQPLGTPIGSVQAFIFRPVPFGYLEFDGQTLNKADYPILFALLPDHMKPTSTTFTLPDLNGYHLVGANAAAFAGTVLGDDTTSNAGDHNHGGATQSHTLTVDEMPSHAHQYYGQVSGPIQSYPDAPDVWGTDVLTSGYTGGDQGHTHGILASGTHEHNLSPKDMKVIWGIRAV